VTIYWPDNAGDVVPVDLDMEFPEGFIGHGLRYAASKIVAHQATQDFQESQTLISAALVPF
jgi:hypothetical protein